MYLPVATQVDRVVMLDSRVPAGQYRAEGMIKNVNTIEEYKDIDKMSLLQQAGKTVGVYVQHGASDD